MDDWYMGTILDEWLVLPHSLDETREQYFNTVVGVFWGLHSLAGQLEHQVVHCE